MTAEQILEKYPRRCPYCDGILPDRDPPEEGEKEEVCPHCGRAFIRVKPPWEEAE